MTASAEGRCHTSMTISRRAGQGGYYGTTPKVACVLVITDFDEHQLRVSIG